MPQAPGTLLEMVLCDADMYHLAEKSYTGRLHTLRREWAVCLGLCYTDEQWIKHMNMDKALFRGNLLREIAKTEKKIADYREMVQPVSPDNAIGRVSRMDAIVNQSVVEAALREAENKLILLQQMESVIDKPEFGVCVGCGNPIPEKRLLLMPQSRKCVACAR